MFSNMSISMKFIMVCTVLYCLTSSGCATLQYYNERAREQEAESQSSVQSDEAYEVPWRLIVVDEAPESMLMKITVFDPEAGVSSVKWERLQYPFKGGILRSHTIKEADMTSVLDVFYDLYFIFPDGTVAEKHFSPVDIEDYSGHHMDIVPQPRHTPSNQLRNLINAHRANPGAVNSIPEADALYEEALQLEKKEVNLFLFSASAINEKRLRLAFQKYDELIKKYPSSDKIDDAAYKAGEICEDLKDYSRAVFYYKRVIEFEKNTLYPARFKAAYILDKKLYKRSEALMLYKQAIEKDSLQRQEADFAQRRVRELSKDY